MSKTNEQGRECPAYCTTDHAEPYDDCTGPRHGTTKAFALAEQRFFKDEARVATWTSGANGFHAIYADNAQHGAWLAEALDSLAAMTKPQIRALAASVREATAEAWPEAEAG